MDLEYFQDKLNSFFAKHEHRNDADLVPENFSSRISCWTVDTFFNLREFNLAFQINFLGLHGLSPAIGNNVLDVLRAYPQQFQNWKDWYQQCLAGESFSVMVEVNGGQENRFEEVHFHPTYSISGVIDGVSCYSKLLSAEDISMEDELAEAERRYRLLTIHSRDIICMHKLDGSFEYINPVSEEVWGHKIENLLGKDPFSLIHPEDLQDFRRVFFLPLYLGNRYTPFSKKFRFKTLEKGYIWLEMLVSVVLDDDDKPIKLISNTRNITNQERQQAVLTHSNKHLKHLLDSIDLGLATVDIMGQFTYLSQAFSNYIFETEGVHVEAGNHMEDFQAFSGLWDQIEEALYGEVDHLEAIIHLGPSKDKFRLSAYPILDEYGDAIGLALLSSTEQVLTK